MNIPTDRNDLEQLRATRNQYDELAKDFRALASQHGAESVRISREIAGFPCDTDWTHYELIIHLGWYHKRHPPMGPMKVLIAAHERIMRSEARAGPRRNWPPAEKPESGSA